MKRTTVRKTIAIGLALLLFCLGSGMTVQALERKLPTYNESEVYEEYPLYLQLIVDQSQAEYEEESVPDQYGTEYYPVIDSSLQVDILASVKETVTADSITVSFSQDAGTLYEGDWSDSGSFRITDLPAYELCYVTVTVETDTETQTYIGQFSWLVDTQNIVSLALCYDKSVIEKGTRNQPIIQESESNNTDANADYVPAGRTAIGHIENASDVDWFRFGISGYGAINQIAITLSAPNNSGTNYDIDIYARRTLTSTLVTFHYINKTGTTDEFYVRPDNEYSYIYVKVSVPSGSANPPGTENYHLHLSAQNRANRTWYSQRGGTINGTAFWNSNKLDQLYFPNYSGTIKGRPVSTLPFITDGSSSDVDIMSNGCFIASAAMVLRNMGKTRSCTDFRTGYSGQMYADPYTVMLANIGKTGSEVVDKSAQSRYEFQHSASHSPIYTILGNIRSAFSAGPNDNDNEDDDNSPTSKVLTNSNRLSSLAAALQAHPEGVVAELNNGTHYIVICGDRGSAYASEERFYICDPGATLLSKGNYVTIAASDIDSFEEITEIFYFF